MTFTTPVSFANRFPIPMHDTHGPWHLEYAFICGAAVLGIFSIGAGFVNDKISLIVLRALSGIGTYNAHSKQIVHVLIHPPYVSAASLTIPSALTLLVNLFPEPAEQARAIGVFGGCGAIGNGEYSTFAFDRNRGLRPGVLQFLGL